MSDSVTHELDVTLPERLEAKARSRALRNDDLDRLDAYRMDFITLEITFSNDDPDPEACDFLRA